MELSKNKIILTWIVFITLSFMLYQPDLYARRVKYDKVLVRIEVAEFIEKVQGLYSEGDREKLIFYLREKEEKFDSKTPEEKREFTSAMLEVIEEESSEIDFNVSLSAGGKSTNTARVITLLGKKNIPLVAFVGEGYVGNKFKELLPEGIDLYSVKSEEDTRVYVTLFSAPDIRFKTRGGAITKEQWDLFLTEYQKVLEEADDGQIVIMGGSQPEGNGLWEELKPIVKLTELAKDKGLIPYIEVHKTWSDKFIKELFQVGPSIVQFNKGEFQNALDAIYPEEYNIDEIGSDEIAEAANKLIDEYDISLAMISLGEKGVVISDGDVAYRSYYTGNINVETTIGAGDALRAGLIYALNNGESLKKFAGNAVTLATVMVNLGIEAAEQISEDGFKAKISEIKENVTVEILSGEDKTSEENEFLSNLGFPPICVRISPSVDVVFSLRDID